MTKIRGFESCYQIYRRDIEALAKYGLDVELDKKYPHGEWAKIGTIGGDEETWTAVVSVNMMPAHFWRFEIAPADGEPTILDTGSGTILDYLPTVELFGRNMIAIKSKEEGK